MQIHKPCCFYVLFVIVFVFVFSLVVVLGHVQVRHCLCIFDGQFVCFPDSDQMSKKSQMSWVTL